MQIPTNMRLLLLLEEVAKAGAPVAATDLCEALSLPKPTVHRLLATAEAEGFLQRDLDGRSYGPGKRMRRFSINTLSSPRIRTERLRIMKRLSEETGETCNLAAVGRDGMVCLDRVETRWPLRIQIPAGTPVPFHCTASGKMYLSTLDSGTLARLVGALGLERRTPRTLTAIDALKRDLDRTRDRGHARENEEFMEGLAAIAVPILDDRNRLLTTLSIHAPMQRLDLDGLVGHLEPLLDAAGQLRDLALQ